MIGVFLSTASAGARAAPNSVKESTRHSFQSILWVSGSWWVEGTGKGEKRHPEGTRALCVCVSVPAWACRRRNGLVWHNLSCVAEVCWDEEAASRQRWGWRSIPSSGASAGVTCQCRAGQRGVRNTQPPSANPRVLGRCGFWWINGGEDWVSVVFVKLPPNTPYWDQVLER